MQIKRSLPWVLLLAVAWTVLTSAVSAGPFDRIFSLDRVEADPEKQYLLDESNGPWLILAATFFGDEAAHQAHELALELRRRYKLHAYVHHMRFEQDLEAEGAGRLGQRSRFVYAKPSNASHSEFAVLVGDFTSVDDPRLQDVLKRVKTMKPDALNPNRHAGASKQTLAAWRIWSASVQGQAAGPMSKAFAIPNPLAELDQNMRGVVDDFIIKMNKENPYNLLDCPRRYTLQVATFDGNYVWAANSQQLKQYETGRKEFKSQLEKAAYMAHRLCEALRLLNYEAYEFHDRNCSIVTVGSWDSIGSQGPDGKIILDPEIALLIKQFQAKEAPNPIPGYPNMIAERLDTLPDIPFDNQPVLVEVPKKSVSAQYRPANVGSTIRRLF